MKFAEVLVCVGFALLSTVDAAAVPSKAGLSHKDKLALEIPVKQHLTNKTLGKQEQAKVSFPTTTTTTTTTTSTTTTEAPKPQRPSYVDAAVFRHQFTTPSAEPLVEGEAETIPEISRVINRDTETFAEEFSFPQTATAILVSGGATAIEPVEDSDFAESYDYEVLSEDAYPFGGELGVLGVDARSAAYLSSFRPIGF